MLVRESARAGLREDVRAALPNALEVRIDPDFAAPVARPRPGAGTGSGSGAERSAAELFDEFCGVRAVSDPRVRDLFTRLHDRVTSSAGGGRGTGPGGGD